MRRKSRKNVLIIRALNFTFLDTHIPCDACKKGHCLSNGTFTTTTVSSASGGHQLYYSCRFRQQLGPILTVWAGYLDTHFESRRKPYFVT